MELHADLSQRAVLDSNALGSHFERHVHGGGEEILVLEGIFSEEQGDYPTGTYLRNGFQGVGTLPGAFRHRQLGYVDALVMVQGLVEGPKR